MSRRLTGAVLAAALSKAAEAAIAGAVETGAQRLATAVDAGLGLPSPPLWGRVGEGGPCRAWSSIVDGWCSG